MSHTLHKTQFHDAHVKLGAKMVEFANYSMPLSYGPIIDEINAVRRDCGKFDVSHMGEFFLVGERAHIAVNELITNDYTKISVGMGIYGFLCNDSGYILDDLICYKISPQITLICVNASNIERDRNHIKQFLSTHYPDVEFMDKSRDYSLIAVQGPLSFEKLPSFLRPSQGLISELPNFSIYPVMSSNDGNPYETVYVAKTGYTGEMGVEIFIPNNKAMEIWTALDFASNCGLAARDTLRVEAGLPLYGHEMSLEDKTTPLDLNLKFAIKMNKGNFVGQKALSLYANPSSIMINLAINSTQAKAIPRAGHIVLNNEGIKMGVVTSGTYSPTLKRGIAIARIDYSFSSSLKNPVQIQIRDASYPTIICNRSFLKQEFS